MHNKPYLADVLIRSVNGRIQSVCSFFSAVWTNGFDNISFYIMTPEQLHHNQEYVREFNLPKLTWQISPYFLQTVCYATYSIKLPVLT